MPLRPIVAHRGEIVSGRSTAAGNLHGVTRRACPQGRSALTIACMPPWMSPTAAKQIVVDVLLIVVILRLCTSPFYLKLMKYDSALENPVA